ncbi:MAG TPA: MFS transporter [Chloroflexota bacterium]
MARALSIARSSYERHRILVWLCVVIFVNQLGFGSIIPIVPLYAQAFGVSQLAIGLTIAVYGLARFLANMPTGQLADRIGRRWSLTLGELVTAVGNVLCAVSGSYEQFLLARFVAGAGAAMVLTSGQIVLADTATPANRGRLMAVYQGVFLFAVGFGPLPGGLLGELLGLAAPFFVFAGLGLVAAAVAFRWIPETRGHRARGRPDAPERASPSPTRPPAAEGLPPLGEQLRLLAGHLGFVLVSLITFVQFFARTGAVFNVVPVLGKVRLGLGPGEVGFGLTLVSVFNLAMVQFSGLLADRWGRKVAIVPATLVAGVAMFGLAVAPSYPWFVAGLALWGLASGLSGPAPAAYAADVAPRGMNATTLSAYRMISDFGYVVGPLLLGWLADVGSPEIALALTAALFAVSGALFALLAPETHKARGDTHRPPGRG